MYRALSIPTTAPLDAYSSPGSPGAELIGDHNAGDGHLTRVLFAAQGLEPLDKALASFRIVFSSVFIALALVSMVLLFQLRNEFDIKARSPYLCILIGAGALAGLSIVIAISAFELFGTEINVFWVAMTYYFFIPAVICAYGCRAIRLAVAFNPRARKAVPQLLSERNHLIGCFFIATCILIIPLYHARTINGPYWEIRFFYKTQDTIWIVQGVFQTALLMLLPVVRNVDDLFGIGRELKILMVLLFALMAGAKLVETYHDERANRWVNSANSTLVVDVITFSISIIDPLRRFYMSESSDIAVRAAMQRTRAEVRASSTVNEMTSRNISIIETGLDKPVMIESGLHSMEAGGEFKEARIDPEVWTWERLGDTPHLASAFEEFARKALCQESVLFLQEVARYQEGVLDGLTDEMQFTTFQALVQQFIFDGAADEINISSLEKKKIMEKFNGGKSTFCDLSHDERMSIFDRAFVDVRYMLEVNLMTRFVEAHDL